MRSKRNHRGILVLTTCVSLTVISAGCRSGKGNMFSFRSEPSPEALAGSGPTTTYPVPPSETATPEAIASVAGGTAPTAPVTTPAGPPSRTAQVAGLDVTPGYIKPASTNMSAAQANGFPGATQSAGFQAPTGDPPSMSGLLPPKVTAPKTGTSGYQFGTNPAAQSSGASSYTIPSSYTAAGAQPSASAPPAVANAGGGSGFTLPADLAGAVTTAGATAGDCSDCDGCQACQGSATKSADLITPSTPGNASYSPGSTADASSYPAPGGSSYLR